LRFGSLLSVNILDTRQYRARQACQERSTTACSEFADPQRSMPGATQEHWLRRKLADSKAQWNVLAQQVPMFGRQATSASADNRHVMDKWSGYPAARERLIRDITAAGLSNVMVLSGDIHSHWAADVPTRMSDPEGLSAAVELTCTSISSGGDGSESADYWPSIRPTHPHVRFHNNQRGYLRCEVSPFQWQADFMVLDSVSQAHARLDSAARVVIEPDNSRVLSA
jgi:alkaline phosphatase D